jgi:hypothetical protein
LDRFLVAILFALRFGFEPLYTANNRAAGSRSGAEERVSSVAKCVSPAPGRACAQLGAPQQTRACRNCKRPSIARKKDRDGSGSRVRCNPHRARSISERGRSVGLTFALGDGRHG